MVEQGRVMNEAGLVMKSGEGEVLRVLGCEVKFVCLGDQTRSAFSLMECKAPRELGPPLHKHEWDEAYYVIEGEVRFTLGSRETIVAAGDFIYAPAGTVHAFRGASEQPCRVLIFDAPAHTEGFFRDTEREVRNMPVD